MQNRRVQVQQATFQVESEYQWLSQAASDGAVVTFTGKVRDHNLGDNVSRLTLEHYPGMTEKVLHRIVDEAGQRWQINKVCVIHRVGELSPGDDIVFVGVSSAHRKDAFESAMFIMDVLKTEAPFWKRESVGSDSRWLEQRESDQQATAKWLQDKNVEE